MALRLETFDIGPVEDVATGSAAEPDEAQLAAFEQGYAAGWEDAAKPHATDQKRIGTDLARNLQGLSLTMQEARRHVLMALRPLVQQALVALLPELARQALPHTILEILAPHAEHLAASPPVVTLNPADRAAVEALFAGGDGFGLVIEEEPTFAEGQAFLRLAGQDLRVDLSGAAAEVATAIRTYFESLNRSG